MPTDKTRLFGFGMSRPFMRKCLFIPLLQQFCHMADEFHRRFPKVCGLLLQLSHGFGVPKRSWELAISNQNKKLKTAARADRSIWDQQGGTLFSQVV